MTPQLLPGAILVAKGTQLPSPLRLDMDSAVNGWFQIANIEDRRQLEKKLLPAGWQLVHIAGTLKATSIGFEKQKTIQVALKELLEMAATQNCNCLEIDDIQANSRFGKTSIDLTAYTRRIQKGVPPGHAPRTPK